MPKIQKAILSDLSQIIKIAETSELFNGDGIEIIKDKFTQYCQGNKDIWLILSDPSSIGIVYCKPEDMTDGTWNTLMLIVSEEYRNRGYGKYLMNFLENELTKIKARLMIVETSSSHEFETARHFYPKLGYKLEAIIKDFYTSNDDKLIFTKSIK